MIGTEAPARASSLLPWRRRYDPQPPYDSRPPAKADAKTLQRATELLVGGVADRDGR